MDERQQGQRADQQEQAVHQPGQRADPPGVDADAVEQQEVEEGEQPAADDVEQVTPHHRAVALARQEGADQQRQAEP